MIWIIAFIVVCAVILDALLKLRLKPELATAAATVVSTGAQGSGPPDVPSSPSKPELAATAGDISIEVQSSGSDDNSSASYGYEYEVFLSFRGSDTRKEFTDSLYHGLLDAGVRTFRDDEGLRVGEEIGPNLLQAIGESKLYLPIFSKDYASSKWCLKELKSMLEHKKKNREHMILPVFYDVTPSEVQDQTGDYGRALQKHKEKYSHEIVEQWKAALNEVGHLKGMDLLKLANGYQGQFIKLIVSKVLSELKKAHLVVTDNLVGVDDHVKALKQSLQLGSDKVKILSIWGLGGIGKTTLAKVIYNQVLGDFEACSFLKDIRETSKRKGLEYLQSLLVADLSSCERPNFTSVDEGIHQLKDRYRGKKVLIVLDDIDDTSQLDALVIKPDSFGPGSRIIVTTRNKNILVRYNVDWIYEVEVMNQDQALELFCRHAFRKETPTDELSSLSCDIVNTTGGLPLALEVIGSLLYGKNKMIWKEKLDKLKMIPNYKVQDKLQMSFEELDHEQKQIFLDIACFFIGEDMSRIFPMWEDCKFFPEIGIDVLVATSLIKIGDDSMIWMHDQVRDLGREIVRQENCKEPGKRSRLWDSEEAKDVLANDMASSNIEAIRCYPDPKQYFKSEQFRNLPKLRFLDLDEDVHLAGDFKNLLPSLRWLKWRSSSFNSMTNLHLPNLISLELPYNDLRNDWQGWGSVQMVKLKVLNLSYSTRLKETPDFCLFPNLEVLVLSSCEKLKVIHPSIAKLKNLTCLNIKSCSRIKELPHQVDSFEKLEIFNACFCEKLTQIPSSICNMTSLSDLSLDDTRITRLADSIGSLLRLRRLSLSGCKDLTQLPETIGRLSLLEVLVLRESSIGSLPLSIGYLFQLQTLDLGCCESLEIFPTLPGSLPSQQVDRQSSLINLEIYFCVKMITLPSLSNLKLLKKLNARGSQRLEELVGLDQLHALEELCIKECSAIKQLPSLSNLKRLTVLNAEGCLALKELVGLDELHALKELDISDCTGIERLPDLSKLQQLKHLRACYCYKLQQLVGVDELKALKILDISGCIEIEKLPDLSKLKQLEELDVSRCNEMKELPGLSMLKQLKKLDVSFCEKLQDRFVWLDELTALENLSLSGFKEIERLPDLSKLKKLEELDVSDCDKLREIVGLDELTSLVTLSISRCKEIEKLPNLSNLKKLLYFYALDCVNLRQLSGFDKLKPLQLFNISGCKEIENLNPSNIWKVVELDISGCEKLKGLRWSAARKFQRFRNAIDEVLQ